MQTAQPMNPEQTNLDAAHRYLAAIEQGETGAALAAFFTPDVTFEGMPNRLTPQTVRQDRAGMLQAAERGLQVIAQQSYAVQRALASGDRVALEVIWTGTLKVPVATLPAGALMRAYFAMFLDFRDGLIAVQRNYDCFEPF